MIRKHGTNAMYAAGCRCADCVEARRVYQAEWRARTNDGKFHATCGTLAGWDGGCRCKYCRQAKAGVHGPDSSYARGCRCDECRKENTVRQREWRETKRIYGISERTLQSTDAKASLDKAVGFQFPGSWSDFAACRGQGERWLLDERDARRPRERLARHPRTVEAIAACEVCPVLKQCRIWVLAHDLDPCPWHVVAAMTPPERNNQRRQMGRPIPGRHQQGEVA